METTGKKRIKNILVACEYSGRVREAFRVLGHNAWSCDLLPAEDLSSRHLQGDCLEIMFKGTTPGDGLYWDIVIGHPPCTDLAVSGARWWKDKPASQMKAASNFFMAFTELKSKWAIENPIGRMSKEYRKPDQIIQPWQYGHETQKSTCLWLSGLPLLNPTNIVNKGEFYTSPNGDKISMEYHKQWGRKDCWKERSRTYPGIADAMGQQWGGKVE